MKILLVTGGTIDRAFAAEFLEKHAFDKVIAVDGGLKFVHEQGVCPLTDIVGDFDTIEPEILETYVKLWEAKKVPVIHKFNPEKDNTDTDIALRLAIEACEQCADAVREIWMLGATGSRLDHVLANITMLLLPYKAGIDAWIMDKNNRISLLHGTRIIKKEDSFGKYISLIPLTSQLRGITLKGVKYPLNDHSISLGDSLCVSNELAGDVAELTVGDGIAVLLETRD